MCTEVRTMVVKYWPRNTGLKYHVSALGHAVPQCHSVTTLQLSRPSYRVISTSVPSVTTQ